MSPEKREFLRLALLLAVIPAVVVFGLAFLYWPSIYLTVPIFAPYYAYGTDIATLQPTIFHDETTGHMAFAGHSVFVGLLSAAAAYRRHRAWVLPVFTAAVALAAVLAHVMLWIFGFTFFMETP